MVDASLSTSIAAAAVGVLAFALALTLRWATRAKQRAGAAAADVGATPVAPGSLPIFKHTFTVLRHAPQIHDWMVGLCDQFSGKPFRVQIIGQEVTTVLNTPELFEDVLKTQFEVFDKGELMCENLNSLLGSGIFAVDGQKWIHQRKTASNLFTMRTLRDSMAHTVRELIPTVQPSAESPST